MKKKPVIIGSIMLSISIIASPVYGYFNHGTQWEGTASALTSDDILGYSLSQVQKIKDVDKGKISLEIAPATPPSVTEDVYEEAPPVDEETPVATPEPETAPEEPVIEQPIQEEPAEISSPEPVDNPVETPIEESNEAPIEQEPEAPAVEETPAEPSEVPTEIPAEEPSAEPSDPVSEEVKPAPVSPKPSTPSVSKAPVEKVKEKPDKYVRVLTLTNKIGQDLSVTVDVENEDSVTLTLSPGESRDIKIETRKKDNGITLSAMNGYVQVSL